MMTRQDFTLMAERLRAIRCDIDETNYDTAQEVFNDVVNLLIDTIELSYKAFNRDVFLNVVYDGAYEDTL